MASSYPNKRIIVADNASTDDSLVFLKQFTSVELLILDRNYGFAEGYNQALKKIQADYYVLLNSDVEVTGGWIEPVIQLMESNDKIGACQPKILSYQKKDSFEYAGAAGGWIDILGYPFARGRVFENCELDRGQYNQNAAIFWASGACLLVRAPVFQAMKGFDGFFFAHMEEIDLCWRMQLSGYTIMCCPASVVYHVGGGTLPKGNKRKVYLNFRNNLIMLSKNLPITEKIWKIPTRIFLDIVFAGKNLISGDGASFAAIGRAHLSFIQWLFIGKKKEKVIKKPMKTLQGVYKGLLITEYFIRKKKSFIEIVKKNL